jgi:hypothetical protein
MKGWLALLLVAAPALADDFDGSWKVPDDQTLAPAKCKSGDAVECLHLAFTAEAGIRKPGQTHEERLADAVAWHRRACEIAKKKPCANAERVQKQLDAAKALKSDAERARFWCADALDGAKRFTETSRTATSVVFGACEAVFPKEFKRGLDVVKMTDGPQKPLMFLVAAREQLCPRLKTKPAGCSGDPGKLSSDKQRAAIAGVVAAALDGELAARADELTARMLR